ncbi:DENN domain-containing protein [Mycena floridula]|nr:DENN domain-containing protein [Mycena floridula]
MYSGGRGPAPTISISGAISEEETDYVEINHADVPLSGVSPLPRFDKASRVLGIRHRQSMEPIPASTRTSIVSNRSVRDLPPSTTPTQPISSLYVVSGLPKSPHTWGTSDPDSVHGLSHVEGAVNRWWRPEILGSTVSSGVSSVSASSSSMVSRKKKSAAQGGQALSKAEVSKMLSKALKLSFPREVEIIASTLQPASTTHIFTFTLPAATTSLGPEEDPFPRPSSAYLGPSGHQSSSTSPGESSTTTYHGVCLTVWSHADAERSTAIRKYLEAGRSRKESAQSLIKNRDPAIMARRAAKKNRGPWTDVETENETENEGGVSESDVASVYTTNNRLPGESTLFLPGDTVFWLPYSLCLISRFPIYDLARDFLTLSWARFSKNVEGHSLQINKILSHPAPRAGDVVRLDASPRDAGDSIEVISRFPGGLDFGRGLVDINFLMWPLFSALSLDNILTVCEIALAPTGRVLFFSKHPAMLGIAVNTIRYLVELRGWNGIALPAMHARDAKIYTSDPGPWILALQAESRHCVQLAPDVCLVDIDVNYVNCPSPPTGAVSVKAERERYRQRLLSTFDRNYHAEVTVPSEFREAFPAGRFRPVCKIQSKRGASNTAIAEQIVAPTWWSTNIIQAFDSVLQERYKKPSLLKRISLFGAVKRRPQLTATESAIQSAIRGRAFEFIDQRDAMDSKLGKLSRRLHFLMNESDLWREKFVSFEAYAEQLSSEASQLRNKINKETKETKRLSSLVMMTAAEKTKLQNRLKATESAHREAQQELDTMRQAMEKMEEDRNAMVAEVEAQIARAISSITLGIEDSEYGGSSRHSSRPSSRLSSYSGTGTRSRRASDAATKRMRSFGTESTLAEETVENDDNSSVDEEEAIKKKRFSAADLDTADMAAVDAGISANSELMAKKVLEIQQKLESALAADRRVAKWKRGAQEESDEEEFSDARPTRPPRPPRNATRKRSGTASSTQTSTSTTTPAARGSLEGTPVRRALVIKPEEVIPEPSRGLSPVNATPTTAEESDTDFQSAYSASPRGSYNSLSSTEDVQGYNSEDEAILNRRGLPEDFGKHRKRLISTATLREQSEPSPTMSESTVITR